MIICPRSRPPAGRQALPGGPKKEVPGGSSDRPARHPRRHSSAGPHPRRHVQRPRAVTAALPRGLVRHRCPAQAALQPDPQPDRDGARLRRPRARDAGERDAGAGGAPPGGAGGGGGGGGEKDHHGTRTGRGSAAHEGETLENVTRARSMLDQAGTAQQAAQANNMLTQALRSLFAVAEAYPDLKANQNFLRLQGELSDIEEKIAYARQFYNRNVLSYNTSVHTFPTMFIANMFGFTAEEFFEAEEEARADVRGSFVAPPAGPAAPRT